MDFSNKKKNKNSNGLLIFIFTFIVVFFGLIFIITNLSPDVDVSIGNEDEIAENTGEEKGNIDERLRWIQLEDNMPGVSNRFITEDEQSELVMPQKEENENDKFKKELETVRLELKDETDPTSRTSSVTAKTQNQMIKVFIGKYQTVEQAIEMQNKLMESDLNLSPYIKSLPDGSYVIQAGVFANIQKAQTLNTQIQSAGFPSRIIKE